MKVRPVIYTEHCEKKFTKKFYASFADHNRVMRKLPLFTDRKNSNEAARCIERLVNIRASGDSVPLELSRFIENTLPMIREKLAQWGVIDVLRVAAGKSLADHLEDWKKFLVSKGLTDDYVLLVTGRARDLFEACGFRSCIGKRTVSEHRSSIQSIDPLTSARLIKPVLQLHSNQNEKTSALRR